MKALVLCAVLGLLGSSALADSLLAPDPSLTPGDVRTSDPAIICVPGYTKTVRDVPQSLKNQVYRRYGITTRKPREFEVDHLISLELGGSNSLINLWPQSYVTQPLGARVKDNLENKLHDKACSGEITFEEAQQAIAQDWIAAYAKYLGPLPTAPAEVPAEPLTLLEPLAADPNGTCPLEAPIKAIGATSSSLPRYYVPEGRPYPRIQAEVCFPSEGAAQDAGYSRARGQ